jgi:hypothetical protein
MLAGESAAMADELRGKRQLRLGDLPSLTDEVVAQIVPAIVPEAMVEIRDEHVFVRLTTGGVVSLFSCTDEDTLAFNRFDGMTTIAQASEELAESMSWSREQAFTRVRGLFLRLAGLGVCVPTNAVG